MLQADTVTFDLPANSICLVAVQTSASGTSPFTYALDIGPVGGFTIDLEGAAIGTTISAFALSGAALTAIDSTVNPTITIPLAADQNATAFSNAVALTILAFARP